MQSIRKPQSRHVLTAAITTAATLLLSGLSAQPAAAATRFVMTAFTNASQSNMNVYESGDATNYNLLKANAYTPPSGLIRDPSIMLHTDGYYYIVYTTGWNGNTIGFARSTDQVNWTFLRNVVVGLNGSQGSTWAPEWFRDSDGSVNVIFSASSAGVGGPFAAYKITATNSALSTWSARTAIGIPENHIDTFVVKAGGVYHAFVKNETTKYIEHATASALTGPWKFVGTGNWAGWGSGFEGPALVQLTNGMWRLYFDEYAGGHYYYADSADLNAWSAKKQLTGLSGTVRHFTVLREDDGSGEVRTGVIEGKESGRCIDVPRSNESNGTRPGLWDCNGGANQQWTLTGTQQLTTLNDRCLDAHANGTADGTPVQIWDCNGGSNQQWTINANGTIVGVQSGKCLDASGNGVANGTPLILWKCNGGGNQKWSRH